MNTTCQQCSTEFEITTEDQQFLDMLSPTVGGVKLQLPPPTQCPPCRSRRRMAQLNQLNLHERKCDFTGSSIISNIRPELPYKVYEQEVWYSDKWDAIDYGRDYDFNKPFFEQWSELLKDVPRPNLFTGFEFDENCTYTNHAGKNKGCYLIFDSDENRDCYYSYSLNGCEDCLDCFRVRKSQLCYQCIDCVQCYGSSYLQDCDNCSDSMFLKNCTGCKNCLMSSNLTNKEYYVENKQVTPEEFATIKAMMGSDDALKSARERFEALKLEFPQKFTHGLQNEDVLGDYLVRCKNAKHCFDSEELWDCRHVAQGFMPLKNCMDIHECGDGEMLYECSVAGYGIHGCLFCNYTLAQMNDLMYCSLCPHSKNCFGCVGLNRKEYCILNKQYTKEQYEELVPKIVEHMRIAKEWGEFFPVNTSVFSYNETLANDYYPMTQEDVLAQGWTWYDEPKKDNQYMGSPVEFGDTITEITDDICKQILTCEVSDKLYKIIPQELAFYQKMNIPLPRRNFFQRHQERMALRNPRVLHARQCSKCSKDIQTTYAPERPEQVYCEECYLSEMY